VIPEPLKRTSHGFPKRANVFVHMHKFLSDRASKNYPPSMLGIPQSSVSAAFLPQTVNAIAQNDDTTRMRTCNKAEFPQGSTGIGRYAEVEASEIEEGTVAFMQDGFIPFD